MDASQLFSLAGALLAAMFGLLTMLLGWIGAKLYAKLDDVTNALTGLHEKINNIDRRVAIVETYQQNICAVHRPAERRHHDTL